MLDTDVRKAPPVPGSLGNRTWARVKLNWDRIRRWGLWIAATAVGLSIVGYFAVPYVLGPIISVTRVTRQDIVQTVVASGQVQTPFRVAIGSQITGVVADVPVEEGQAVKAGDLLIQIDDTDAHEQVKLAQGAVEQAQARLKQLTDVVAQLPHCAPELLNCVWDVTVAPVL